MGRSPTFLFSTAPTTIGASHRREIKSSIDWWHCNGCSALEFPTLFPAELAELGSPVWLDAADLGGPTATSATGLAPFGLSTTATHWVLLLTCQHKVMVLISKSEIPIMRMASLVFTSPPLPRQSLQWPAQPSSATLEPLVTHHWPLTSHFEPLFHLLPLQLFPLQLLWQ